MRKKELLLRHHWMFFKRVDRTESARNKATCTISVRHEWGCRFALHLLLLTALQLCHLPPPLSPPVSDSSHLLARCQALCASYCTMLLYFSRCCTVRLKMSYFLYVLFVWKVLSSYYSTVLHSQLLAGYLLCSHFWHRGKVSPILYCPQTRNQGSVSPFMCLVSSAFEGTITFPVWPRHLGCDGVFLGVGLHLQNYVGWLQHEHEVRLRLEPCLILSLAVWPRPSRLTPWRTDFQITKMGIVLPFSHRWGLKRMVLVKPPCLNSY